MPHYCPAAPSFALLFRAGQFLATWFPLHASHTLLATWVLPLSRAGQALAKWFPLHKEHSNGGRRGPTSGRSTFLELSSSRGSGGRGVSTDIVSSEVFAVRGAGGRRRAYTGYPSARRTSLLLVQPRRPPNASSIRCRRLVGGREGKKKKKTIY